LARHHHFDCVLTTSPPDSVHVVGAALERRRIPWIADLRDGWSFESTVKEELWPTRVQHRLSEWMESRLLHGADAVTTITQPLVDDLRERLGIRAELVPNGWQPGGEALDSGTGPSLPDLDPERISVVYTGVLAESHRDPKPLITALGRLAQQDPGSARRLEIVFAGSFTPEERRLLTTNVAPARILNAGHLDRAAVSALQQRADAGILINHPGRRYEAGMKLFEYIGARLPILALARGDSAAAGIVSAANGLVVPTHDVGAIEKGLRTLAHGRVRAPSDALRESFSWPVVCERLVEVAHAAIHRREARN
jgi:glycosyltransferase involved in cell wall biosynthesis